MSEWFKFWAVFGPVVVLGFLGGLLGDDGSLFGPRGLVTLLLG